VDFDDLNRTVPGPLNAPGVELGKRFWLESQGRNIELRVGLVLVGRSSGCHIVLDDALVSRRHAQFIVTKDSVVVEDLGSVNGVYVNSRRVEGSEPLREADRVQIGKSEFVVHSANDRPREERHTAETLHGFEVPAELLAKVSHSSAGASPPNEDSTRQGDVFELLGTVADKVLALGRGDEAERILSTALTNLLVEARAARMPNPRSAERAVAYAVKIAEATGHARWVDYCFDLYRVLKRPLPAEVVDHLYSVVRKVSGVSLPTLREYLATLQVLAPNLGPRERFVLQRLEGLERVAAR
jgi:pSer/pThr/pTyr-binding forkhead associated (FHA) protein